MNENKIIGGFKFKSKSPKGYICKTNVYVHANGIADVNQVFLVPENEPLNPPAIKIYTKLGKSIFVVAFGLKYTSLFAIFNGVTDVIESNNVKATDII